MTVSAVILAGGRGTRSEDPTKAKIAQVIGGKSLLEWHLHLLEASEIWEAIVVAGHLGDQVSDLGQKIDPGPISLRVVREVEQRGTVAALSLGASLTEADEFLVILGDILMSLPIQSFLNSWRASGTGVGVVVHASTHPEDSDAVFPSHDGSVIVAPKSAPRDHIPNMSSAGLFAITRDAIKNYQELKDIGSDVLDVASKHGDLFAFVSSHYLKDTGTPERLQAVHMDIGQGVLERRGRLQGRPALFLDRDGVINPSRPEFYKPQGYSLLPGVAVAIREANSKGIPVIVVTNQPAIAKGFMTFEDHQGIRARMDRLLGDHGSFVDDYLFCPHHPEFGFQGERSELKMWCHCRKPQIGLAIEARSRHALDLESSVMIGDSIRDRGFAMSAGMQFVHVGYACQDTDDAGCFTRSEIAIRRGLEIITC